MKQITREWLAFLREQYPVGSRIRLNSMEDPYAPVEPGTMGTLQRIDDAGQFLMKWDNGRTLSLIPGEDSFSLILPEPTMMKLYMPLHADLYTKDDWSDTSEEPEMLTGRALMEYEDSILIALIKNRMSEEAERGIMRWYGREDSVDRKVKSVVFTAEEREGQLWDVAECKVVGELTPEELDTLCLHLRHRVHQRHVPRCHQDGLRLSAQSLLFRLPGRQARPRGPREDGQRLRSGRYRLRQCLPWHQPLPVS